MDREALFGMQLALERKEVDAHGRLARIPGPEPDEMGRVHAVRLGRALRLLIRGDVPQDVADELRRLGPRRAFSEDDRVRDVLAAHAPCEHIGRGMSYIPPEPFDERGSPDVVVLTAEDRALLVDGPDPGMADIVLRRPVFAVVVDRRAVAACVSIREDDRAAEAWVVTDPVFRRHGYGRQTVAAWTAHVIGMGKTAFYSHDLDNHASAGVAKSLRLRPWMQQTVYV